MRVIECNECGETISAASDEELVRRVRVVRGRRADARNLASRDRDAGAGAADDHRALGAAVEHDDGNVLCLGGRVIGPALAAECLAAFASAEFSGEERHVRRLGKIAAIEREFAPGS